jgi:OOP family OmpA-OmpF porin
MSKRSFGTAAAAVVLVLGAGGAAQAQQLQIPGLYVGVHGGGAFMPDADTNVRGGGGTNINGNASFSDGWLGGAAVGYEMPLNWAVPGDSVAIEEEFTYRDNGLSNFSAGGGNVSLNGHLTNYAVMTNGYYRYNTGTPFTPYVGVGIGPSIVNLHGTSPLFGGNDFDDNSITLAYQGIVGVSYPLTPQISLGLEYRYFGTTRPHFSDTVPGVGPTKINAEDRSHNVLVNLTYHFQ